MMDSDPSDLQEKRERVQLALDASSALRKQKRFHEGIEVLREALDHRIQEDQVYYRLGNLYYDSGDLNQAEAAYKRAIDINRNHVNAHHNLSVVYKQKGKISEFVKAIRKAAKLSMQKPGR